MAGPWENYQKKSGGPWTKYGAQAPQQEMGLLQKAAAISPLAGAGAGLFENIVSGGVSAADAFTAGARGLAAAVPGGKSPAEAVNESLGKWNYEPRTDAGQKLQSASNFVGEKFENFADWAGEASKTEDTQNVGAAAVKTAIMAAPMLLGYRGRGAPKKPKLTQQQQILQTASQEGYVAPPVSANPQSVAANVMEGVGGKIKTQQLASIKNQEVTNRLAARSLNLPEDTPMSVDVLEGVRAEAGQAFRDVGNIGQVATDASYRRDISKATSRIRSASGQFKTLVKKEILDIADDLRQQSFDSDAAMSAISELRDKADVAYRAGDKGLGKSYRGLANAVESVIERHLVRTNADPALVQNYRNARVQIAKSYDVQDALSGGNINAATLASKLKKGKYLDGDLKMIAEFAQAFPRATQLFNQSFNAYSPLDLFAQAASGATGVATGQPALLAPAALSLSRPGFRSLGLSRLGQNMVAPRAGTNALLPTGAVVGSGALLDAEEQM